MHATNKEPIPLQLTYYALGVMFFCTLPHIFNSPWWLSLIIIAVVCYRILANYRHYPIPSTWKVAILMVVIMILLRLDYGHIISSRFFIGMLVTLFWLKIIEMRHIRDLRALVLINFYVIFASLILHHELWIFGYMLIAISANLSLMVKLDAPNFRLNQLHINLLKSLIVAIPMSLLLFFIFPRFHSPFWGIPLNNGQIGFSETMTPGSFSELFGDDRLAMRITFNRPIKSHQYWTGLYLSNFNGFSWTPIKIGPDLFTTLHLLTNTKKLDYEIMLEPNEKKWLFFLDNPNTSNPTLKYSSAIGLTLLSGKPVGQRLSYGLKSGKTRNKVLSLREQQRNLRIPKKSNLRLQEWAAELSQKVGRNPQAFIAHIHYHILNNHFWYRLAPNPTKRNLNQLSQFWFETQEGYCEHYASAVTFILRAAGIPARVVVGYYGGEWNPIANYLTIRQQNAHAWIEYWQQNKGWRRLDPTLFISPKRIDQTIRQHSENQQRYSLFSDWGNSKFTLTSWERLQLSFDSARFFWERWLLFYNADRQYALLETLGLENWDWIKLAQLWIGSLLLFLFLGVVWHYIRERQKIDPLKKSYNKIQRELHKLGIKTPPSSSINQQLRMLARKHPEFKDSVDKHLTEYETLRYRKKNANTPSNRKKTIKLFKSLRRTLKK